MLYLIFLISLVSTQSFAQNSETNIARDSSGTHSVIDDAQPRDSKCSAPGKGGGSCVSLSRCPKYLKLNQTQTSLSKYVNDSLKNAYCGYKKGEYFVCCKTDEQCGNIVVERRSDVFGRRPTLLGAWPWMAAIYLRDSSRNGGDTFRFQCGGTLISKEWVLTAAHCVPEKMNEELSHVRLGEVNLNPLIEDGADPIDVEIEKVIKHPMFRKTTFSNDIALVKLKSPVKFTDHIRPICLHTDEKYKNITYYDRKKPIVIGWGSTESTDETRSDHLMETEIYVTPFSQCAKMYKSALLGMQENILCASASGKDGCLSDSGGPLMVIESGTCHQIGIVSSGYDCARKTYPGVYTKVVTFTNWINEITGLYS